MRRRNHPLFNGLCPHPGSTETAIDESRLMNRAQWLRGASRRRRGRVSDRETVQLLSNGRRRAESARADCRPLTRHKGAGASDAVFPDRSLVRVALDAGQVGVWSWDIKIQRGAVVGQSGRSIHGIADGKLGAARSPSFQQDIHPEDQPEVIGRDPGKPAHRQALSRALPARAADRTRTTAGSRRSASVVQENGEPVRLLGICRDVTDRQKLLRELRARAKQQEIVARLGERALTETDLQTLFDEIVATVAEILDVEFVKILELVPGDAELLLRAGHRLAAPALVGTAHEIDRPPFACGLRARLGRAGDRHRSQIRDAVREPGAAARPRRQQRRERADRRARRARLRRARRAHGAPPPLRRVRRRRSSSRSPT